MDLEINVVEKIDIITKNIINLSMNTAAVVINESRTVIILILESLDNFPRNYTFGPTSVGIITDHLNELFLSFTNYPDYSSSERLNCLKILRYIRMSLKMYDDKYEYNNNRINEIIGITNRVK